MISIKNVSKSYGKGEAAVKALDNVSLEIKNGELVAITGKSGSGKSTLLNVVGGLAKADAGEVLIEGKDILKMGDSECAATRLKNIGFVFQFFDLIPELTALENITFPAKLAKNRKPEYREMAEKLGITDRLSHYPSQLSGGQQQRVAIARALINNPEIILCDEPTGNLDEASGREVMEILKKLSREEGKTVLIVTHDMAIAGECDRVVRLSDGKVMN